MLLYTLLLGSCLVLQTPAAGQPPRTTAQPSSSSTSPAVSDYVVGPQDVLNVQVYGEPDLTRTVTVDADGTFDFPLVGRVRAGGLTIRGVASELSTRLESNYLRSAQVTIEVGQYRSQRIYVQGEVRSPGEYPLKGSVSIMQLLAAAGSPTPNAAPYIVVRRPPGGKQPLTDPEPGGGSSVRIPIKDLQSGLLPATFSLRDGDTVVVPRAETFYVTGYVKSPGPYTLESGMTVMQALASAGGVSERGAPNRIRITRMVNGRQEEIKNVKMGQLVRPGDTIYVPQRFF